MQSKTETQHSAIERLLAVMTMLRNQEFGCPWDLKQSIRSLIPYTLEEVYEVVDAIENDDMVELEDELGDLLFQIVFYAQIAAEQGLFDFDDVAAAITRKLIRRHPHVFPEGDLHNFGQEPELNADQVVVNWELIKQQEREDKRRKRGGDEPADGAASVLDDVPKSLPAVERARKLQKRAASHGFDWDSIGPVLDKLDEEVAELKHALETTDKSHIHHELGDVLFAAVNLARHCRVEPEIALRDANRRFENRFRWIESTLHQQGKSLDNTELAVLDSLWEQAKAQGY